MNALDYHRLRFVFDPRTGNIDTLRDGKPHTPNAQSLQSARLAITKAHVAYGYAHGMLNAQSAPAHPAHTHDAALAFANAYARLIYRANGTTWLSVADAYATWTATGQLDQIGPNHRRHHTHPTAYTHAQVCAGTDWPEGTRFIAVGPPPEVSGNQTEEVSA